jgi:hypothetical protein
MNQALVQLAVSICLLSPDYLTCLPAPLPGCLLPAHLSRPSMDKWVSPCSSSPLHPEELIQGKTSSGQGLVFLSYFEPVKLKIKEKITHCGQS